MWANGLAKPVAFLIYVFLVLLCGLCSCCTCPRIQGIANHKCGSYPLIMGNPDKLRLVLPTSIRFYTFVLRCVPQAPETIYEDGNSLRVIVVNRYVGSAIEDASVEISGHIDRGVFVGEIETPNEVYDVESARAYYKQDVVKRAPMLRSVSFRPRDKKYPAFVRDDHFAPGMPKKAVKSFQYARQESEVDRQIDWISDDCHPNSEGHVYYEMTQWSTNVSQQDYEQWSQRQRERDWIFRWKT